MQLQIFQYDSYLEPAVIHKWNTDQRTRFQQKLDQGGKVAVGGDMRADSPG